MKTRLARENLLAALKSEQKSLFMKLESKAMVVLAVLILIMQPAMAADTPVPTQPFQIKPPASSSPGTGPSMTITEAIDMAQEHYPKIYQLKAEVAAQSAGVKLEKINQYVPNSLMSYQQVVATHNKLTQIVFPDPTLPPNPGPGQKAISFRPLFFSGSGFIVDWNPIDFGKHKAKIDLSKTTHRQSLANLGVTRLQAGTKAADSFLSVLLAREQVRAAEYNVRSFQKLRQVVSARVNADLRPGVDLSLAEAQLASARNHLIEALKREQVALADLEESLGMAGRNIQIDPRPILQVSTPGQAEMGPFSAEMHPEALLGKANVDVVQGAVRVLEKTYYPNIRWLGGMNLRGAGLGINAKQRRQSKNVYGLFPVVPNWHVGLMIQLPFLDYWKIKTQKQVEQYHLQAQKAGYQVVIQRLIAGNQKAKAEVEAAEKLLENVPVELNAARQARDSSVARYQAGLGTIADVAQAEIMLAQAQFKMAGARVGIWKALLDTAVARGNLDPFVAVLSTKMKSKQ